ncbi:membrane protein insertase YidC [Staphylococcus hominis]|uniref:membrane protein insertase YidC n=1 Tax=Staphylococcus hominis TaxID=1290 RepID=UPI002879BBD9|nr:membrane protein insertase YidC [Staphylococcus hominis]MDS3924952.1 membrane protein insertase YidC [Staphylococcus hominis]
MKKKALLPLLLGVMVFLAGCDYSKSSNRNGFFYNTFVEPMAKILHWLGHSVFHDDYGIAIIVLVLVIRIILLPFMLSNYKNSHMMREKMKIAKPEVEGVQEKVKRARTQEEKMAANQEMMEVYKKYDINPMKSALGCLPVLIQMPIVMGLYFVLRYRIGGGITEHPHFLWFNLVHPDIWITIIAGVLYFIQAWVSSKQVPEEQRQMTYMMMIVSPIMIIWISLSSASALGLYWSVSAAFLIIQIFFANKHYEKVAKQEIGPMVEAHKENNSNKKGKNTQVVSKNNKKKK